VARRIRRLVADGDTYLWTTRHVHERVEARQPEDCREVVALRRDGDRGRVEIVFRAGAGRHVGDGRLHSGGVVGPGGYRNLHEPGVVRGLLDAALAHGWRPEDPAKRELDGWSLGNDPNE